MTLRRLDLMPAYTWFMDAAGGHYLILLLNGYFRNDLSDIAPAVNRLWMIHAASQLTVIDFFSVSTENREYGQSRLRQFFIFTGIKSADYRKLASTDFRHIKIWVKQFVKCQYRAMLGAGCLRIEMQLW